MIRTSHASVIRIIAIVCVGAIGALAGCGASRHTAPVWLDDLITTSERSDYRATETHAEVVAIMDRIAERSPIAHRAMLGYSFESRELPLLILADPPVASSREAHQSGKLIVYLQANIHGGEVCGKPALLQLARDIALNPRSRDRALLNDMILVLCPIYNADGNDRIAPGNRGDAQNGPELGMGERANAQGFDLNRDHMKLESPETQALAAFLTEWNPHLTIDSHTTNGSLHEYALTYAAPQNPSGHAAPIEFVRDQMLPDVSKSLEERTGLKTFFYGNFDRERTVWATYSHMPRFATPYRGLRNRMSILAEAYAYDTYEERVNSTREFIRECLHYATNHRQDIIALLDLAEQATITAAKGRYGDEVGIRYDIAAFDEPVTIPAFERVLGDDGQPTGELTSVSYTVDHFGRFEPTLSVVRPVAYAIPAGYDDVIAKLEQHGVIVERLGDSWRADVELYTIDNANWSERPFQGHRLATVEATPSTVNAVMARGSWVVPMNQPLASLAVYLLEPESDDGLVAWNYFDDDLRLGQIFPVARVLSPRDEWIRTEHGVNEATPAR